jgi:hypothetical protein
MNTINEDWMLSSIHTSRIMLKGNRLELRFSSAKYDTIRYHAKH